MKRLLTCLLIAAAATSLMAQDQGSPESKIVAMEKAWNQAFKFRDKKALGEILHDSIVLVNDDGTIGTKAGFLASVEAAKQSEDQQAEPESISVHVFGNVAVATGVFKEKGIENGKPYLRRNRFVDTWMLKNGNWVCIAASATPVLH